MDDPDSNHKPENKRPADSKPEERRPPKVRRFDMKTRVPKAPKSDTASSVDSLNEDDKDVAASRDKCIVVTAVVTKGERARTLTENTTLPAAAKSAEIAQRLASTAETAGDGRNQEDSAQVDHPVPLHHDPAADPMSVNRMFQTSLDLQQQAEKEGRREGRGFHSPSHHRNIVDHLFQAFVSTKMRGVDEGPRGLPGEEGTSSGTEMDGEKSESMDEISRLLDAEISSIKSRSEVPRLTAFDLFMLTGGNGSVVNSENVTPQNITAEPTDLDSGAEWVEAEPVRFSASQSLSMAEAFADADDMFVLKGSVGSGSQETSGVEVKGGSVLRKKPEVKKLGLNIGAETLARIVGTFKNGHFLEEGEVASSTDSDGDKAFKVDRKADEEEEEESDNSDEVSGTGSLSDSDRGKDEKTKKRKKHKHKHKKKKKHKSQSKEKEKGEEEKKEGDGEEEHSIAQSVSTERKSSKEKKSRKSSRDKSDRKSSKEKEDASKERRSKDKDRKKSSHHSTKGDELFDPWDARNYREDGVKRSRSRSPLGAKSKHKERSREGKHSKEKSREHSKERHHCKRKSQSRERSRKRSHSKEQNKEMSSKDKEKEQSDLRVKIDKNKLRKIAIARTLANMEKGKCPSVNLTTIKSGGKSVAELTEFCKLISQKESLNDSSDSAVSEEEESDAEEGPLHHPFIMRDPSTLPNIVMNIRNARQLPILTPQEKQTQAATLRTQFPVSSGTQHRGKESEWVPVTTSNTTNTNTTTTTTTIAVNTPGINPVVAVAAVMASAGLSTTTMMSAPVAAASSGGVGGGGGGMPAPPPPPAAAPTVDSVFPPTQHIDIGSIVSERIQAMRQLKQNPFDIQALSSVHKSNEQANMWAQSKHLPGQFTGTTDVKILTQEELAGPDKRNQAWVKKDQFRRAPPLRGGIGMLLLQKMGWKPGDGLGKDNEGKKEPLMLDVKMDRKGLTTSMDHRLAQPMMRPPHPVLAPPGFGLNPGAPFGVPRGPLLFPPGTPRGPLLPGAPTPAPQRAKDLSGKHPVSALTELCTKRRWGAPAFDLISELGPAHKKMFLFKVRVNGVEYMPAASCGNKKLAKAQAAAICLQEMGLIPRDFVVQV